MRHDEGISYLLKKFHIPNSSGENASNIPSPICIDQFKLVTRFGVHCFKCLSKDVWASSKFCTTCYLSEHKQYNLKMEWNQIIMFHYTSMLHINLIWKLNFLLQMNTFHVDLVSPTTARLDNNSLLKPDINFGRFLHIATHLLLSLNCYLFSSMPYHLTNIKDLGEVADVELYFHW